MLRLIAISASIGLADSINPSTIGPALYMAGGPHARDRVLRFTAGVFLVYLLGGAAIALGPGQLLLSLVPRPDQEDRAVLEIIAGVAMLIASFFLWRFRERLSKRRTRQMNPERKSSALLGATITAIELPTAFPYFAAIAAIVGSGYGIPRQVFLLVLFNVCFVLPLVGIVALLTFSPARAQETLTNIRDWLQARWPPLLATLALVAGLFVILLGTAYLASPSGRFTQFLHHLPLHP
ncbi:MAG TPA: GAP family protein [Solirubrobacteraceae bacterium]|jgi:cytochrome c biogenesis protein CcdA|nr:GAP family protein [Solirubrobacteraceae bacterium]